MVGMTTNMVMFALGQPDQKVREMDGQMPFEEWIYGKPPDPVQFVRINGNRVIRVEVAKVGEPPQIFTQDEVEPLMRAGGTPIAPASNTKTIAMGDTHANPDTQAPAAPPSFETMARPSPRTIPEATQRRDPCAPSSSPSRNPTITRTRPTFRARPSLMTPPSPTPPRNPLTPSSLARASSLPRLSRTSPRLRKNLPTTSRHNRHRPNSHPPALSRTRSEAEG